MTRESKALVHRARTPVRAGERSPAARGARALVKLAGARGVRHAVVTGVAFGLGYQLSRMLRTGRLPDPFETAWDAYRAVNGGDPVAEGRITGRWVRRSMAVVATAYGYVDRDEG